MIISAIVAMARNRVIGVNNQIPWYLPADLRFFKKTTMGHHVIMGRRTFMSIGKPLPGRTNIVVSRNPFFLAEGILVAHSLEEALYMAMESGEKEAFVIGGGQLYLQAMSYLDKVYITRVDAEVAGDTYFPELSPFQWKQLSRTAFAADDRNAHGYAIEIYESTASKTEEEE